MAMGVTISTDLNYRAKLWKYDGDREAIMTELTSYCDIILGNEEDAEMHFGIKPEGLDITTQGERKRKLVLFVNKCKQNSHALKDYYYPTWGRFRLHTTLGQVLYDGETMYEVHSTNHTYC